MSAWTWVGGAAAVLVAAGVIVNLKDIRRYLRIKRM
jgi:hypothetical protein